MIFIIRQDINGVFSGVPIVGIANTSHNIPNDKADDVAREMRDASIKFDILSKATPEDIKRDEVKRSTFAVKKAVKKNEGGRSEAEDPHNQQSPCGMRRL